MCCSVALHGHIQQHRSGAGVKKVDWISCAPSWRSAYLKPKESGHIFEPWPTFVIVLVNTTHNIKQIYNSEIVHVMSKVSNSALTHFECPHPSTRTLVSIHCVGTSIYTGRLWPRR